MSRFVIDPRQSILEIQGSSSVHAFRGATPVRGHLDVLVRNGRLDLIEEPAGELHVDVAELQGDDPRLAREIQRRIDAERYPHVTAVLSEVRDVGDGSYLMIGQLTLHGRTREVMGPADVRVEDGRLRLDGTLTIDIRNFGIRPPKLLMTNVDPAVELRLACLATETVAAAC